MNRLFLSLIALVSLSIFASPSFAADVPAKDTTLQSNFHISEEAPNLQKEQFNLLIMEEPQSSIHPIGSKKLGLKQNCSHVNRAQTICF